MADVVGRAVGRLGGMAPLDPLGAGQRRRAKLRALQIVSGLERPACAVCGETDPDVLVLDHVHSDGAACRRQHGVGYQFYLHVVAGRYPAERLQVLCANDNQRKAIRERREGLTPSRPTTVGRDAIPQAVAQVAGLSLREGAQRLGLSYTTLRRYRRHLAGLDTTTASVVYSVYGHGCSLPDRIGSAPALNRQRGANGSQRHRLPDLIGSAPALNHREPLIPAPVSRLESGGQ